METLEMKAELRTTHGKGSSRTLRRAGRIPAVLYGPHTDPVSLTVDMKELDTALKKGGAGRGFLNLAVENGKKTTKAVMIKELQTDPVSQGYLHVDFYEIDMNRKLRVDVPVVVKGKCKGVEEGGILQVVRREVEVSCLPAKIPHAIEIDVTDLEVGDAVHVSDLAFGEGIEIVHDVNFTVVTVVSPKVERTAKAEEEEGEAAEGVEPAAEPEEGE